MARLSGLLSVVVPVYNVEAYLGQCVRSILAQTYAPLEVLLIDDGSTDGSGALCDAFATEDARVRVIHQPNGGLSAARNAGLDMANGAWVAFVDSDDWVLPETFATLIALCEETGAQIAACAFNYVFPDREQPAGDTGAVSVFTRDEALLRLAAQREARFEACARVYRREAIGDMRFVPGQIYEDVRFTRLTFMKMERYAYIDRAMYQYRQKRSGSTNSSFPKAKLRVLDECDAFAAELHAQGLTDAEDGMRAFTLDHIMRMFSNARACGAEAETLQTLRRAYRQRYWQERNNPAVRKLRGLLFALSPDVYHRLSQMRQKAVHI